MFNKIKKGFKGVKKYMEEKVQMCKEVLENEKNKLTLGLVLIGIGGALIASIYIPMPNPA